MKIRRVLMVKPRFSIRRVFVSNLCKRTLFGAFRLFLLLFVANSSLLATNKEQKSHKNCLFSIKFPNGNSGLKTSFLPIKTA